MIGDNAWVGMRSAILKGAIINNNAILTLYSLVNGLVPQYNLAFGNPYDTKKMEITSLLTEKSNNIE